MKYIKNKKGFTLIELLAVIVILAILIVIAVPKILDVINGARSSLRDSSIKLLKNGIKTEVTASHLNEPSRFTQENTDDGVCYKFDFDNKNTNYQNLKVDNKDQFTGYINYCNDGFHEYLGFKNAVSNSNSDSSSTNSEKIYIYNRGQTNPDFKLNTSVTWYRGNNIAFNEDNIYCGTSSFGTVYTDEMDFSQYEKIVVVVDNIDSLGRIAFGTNRRKTNSEVYDVYFSEDNTTIENIGENLYRVTYDLSDLGTAATNTAFGMTCYLGTGERKLYELYLID